MPELGQDQSAEPKQCGSCQYFKHRQPKYDTMGICSFRLPPWVWKRGDNPPKNLNEDWVDPRTVSDTDGCDLYEAKNLAGDPAEFTQLRIWRAGNPSR